MRYDDAHATDLRPRDAHKFCKQLLWLRWVQRFLTITRVRQAFEGRRTLRMDERVEALICAMLRMPRVSRKLWYSECLVPRHHLVISARLTVFDRTCIPADVRAKGRFDPLFDLKAATATTPFPSSSMFSRNEPTIRKFLAFEDE